MTSYDFMRREQSHVVKMLLKVPRVLGEPCSWGWMDENISMEGYWKENVTVIESGTSHQRSKIPNGVNLFLQIKKWFVIN